MGFRDLFEEQVTRHGQGGLACALGVDASVISRFRSGEGGLRMEVVDRFFEVARVEPITAERKDKMLGAIEFLSGELANARRGQVAEEILASLDGRI